MDTNSNRECTRMDTKDTGEPTYLSAGEKRGMWRTILSAIRVRWCVFSSKRPYENRS
jgi:hypothetical protein